jgi:hypothetical protein
MIKIHDTVRIQGNSASACATAVENGILCYGDISEHIAIIAELRAFLHYHVALYGARVHVEGNVDEVVLPGTAAYTVVLQNFRRGIVAVYYA